MLSKPLTDTASQACRDRLALPQRDKSTATGPEMQVRTVWVVRPPGQWLSVDLRHHQALASLHIIHGRVDAHAEQVLVVGRQHTCRQRHSTRRQQQQPQAAAEEGE